MNGAVAFVLKGYPRLSETFIAQEIHGLEERGLDIRIYSLRAPREAARNPVHSKIRAPVVYLPEYLGNDARRVFRAWRQARRLPGYRRVRALFLGDLRRDPTRNRIRRFGQALVLAAELPDDIAQIHAHFLHTPASVARYAAVMRNLPWTCSAHAKDIWTTPEWELAEKLSDAAWVVTCTSYGTSALGALAPEPDKVGLVYHGLDLSDFPPPPEDRRTARDGTDPDEPVRLLSVGRAVEKKGYDVLLSALAGLPDDFHWTFVHIGAGELEAELEARAQALGLDDRITWLGDRTRQQVVSAIRDADLFILPSRIAADGDRDGLPNVLMEAASQELPILSTAVAAIPEFVTDGKTGLLVPPEEPEALGQAILALSRDPSRRHALAQAAHERLRSRFAAGPNLDHLAARFGLSAAKAEDAPRQEAAG